jgi:AcrR family transcriptional regulator
MIYYYFGDKEGLYRHALENAYREVRQGEGELDIEGLPPIKRWRGWSNSPSTTTTCTKNSSAW